MTKFEGSKDAGTPIISSTAILRLRSGIVMIIIRRRRVHNRDRLSLLITWMGGRHEKGRTWRNSSYVFYSWGRLWNVIISFQWTRSGWLFAFFFLPPPIRGSLMNWMRVNLLSFPVVLLSCVRWHLSTRRNLIFCRAHCFPSSCPPSLPWGSVHRFQLWKYRTNTVNDIEKTSPRA